LKETSQVCWGSCSLNAQALTWSLDGAQLSGPVRRFDGAIYLIQEG
jgi:hypothetical protein